MTYEQFWELPADLRAEYSDGEFAMAVGWQLIERRRLRIPDVVVLTCTGSSTRATG